MTVTTTSPGTRGRFRADIQGMRAIAIGLVLLYHADLLPVSGGYVGVDVFFVISGYLITAHLVRDLDRTGKVDLAAFWARRIRRLLPASWLVLLVTLVLSWFVVPPLARPGVAQDGAFTAIYGVNVWLASRMTNYLDSGMASPFQHYWSLAVEEQFYLLWPIALLLIWRLRRRFVAVAVLVVLSYGLSIWLSGVYQPVAFFMLPTRAWELGVGALLALAPAHRLQALPPGLRSALTWGGLGLIVICSLIFDHDTVWPGAVALVPVIATAVVLAFGHDAGLATRVLSSPPMQYLGRISYSLYLWHWPLLILPVWAGVDLSWGARLGLAGLSIVLADLTQRYVEVPGQRMLVRPRQSFGFGALGTAVTVGACLLAMAPPTHLSTTRNVTAWTPASDITQAGDPGFVPANVTPDLADAAGLPEIYDDGCHLDFPTTHIPEGCWYGPETAQRQVVLLGDSHAAHWFPGLALLAEEQGFRLWSLTKSSCTPADITVHLDHYGRTYRECDQWREDALAQVAALEDPTVIVADSRNHLPLDGSGEDGYAQGLQRSIHALGPDATVVVVGDGPWFETSRAVCLSASLDDSSACASPRSDVVRESRHETQRVVASETGATYVDAAAWLCPDGMCSPLAANVLKLGDANHLSVPFAAALAPQWQEVLGGLATGG